MKVLVVDKFPDSAIQQMKALGFEVAYNPDMKGDALVAEVKKSGADVLVVRSTKVTEPMLEAYFAPLGADELTLPTRQEMQEARS